MSLRKRILIWAWTCAVAALVLFPWSHAVGPENNVIAGPMWLLKTKDFPLGLVLTGALLPCALLVLLLPSRLGVVISLLAAAAWVAIGVRLAMIAVC